MTEEKRFYPLFAVMGIYLILDGIFSIIFQINEDLMWHEVRIARIILGVLVIHIRNHPIERGFEIKRGLFRFDCFLIGLILFFDSIISIVLQSSEPIIFQIGRFIRLVIAIYLMVVNFILIKAIKEKNLFRFKTISPIVTEDIKQFRSKQYWNND